jgi:hypothetical protein
LILQEKSRFRDVLCALAGAGSADDPVAIAVNLNWVVGGVTKSPQIHQGIFS